ncbi:hypothetical protein [Sinimarinibacterium sp. NLF-5-8]|uniref:hypothetical protein n=1 Tax=Sinimarinibacterium sp. NLF-5-8 TaxID=2698684 RepID=UPI00137BF8A7|nr:hypothetical protein [Sinimarinibacterium sp. NLF-5-8]QHS10430.1 hypothetical protein GT972_09995 [Sinimarinibacterium sp. NLF-5-8]
MVGEAGGFHFLQVSEPCIRSFFGRVVVAGAAKTAGQRRAQAPSQHCLPTVKPNKSNVQPEHIFLISQENKTKIKLKYQVKQQHNLFAPRKQGVFLWRCNA